MWRPSRESNSNRSCTKAVLYHLSYRAKDFLVRERRFELRPQLWKSHVLAVKHYSRTKFGAPDRTRTRNNRRSKRRALPIELREHNKNLTKRYLDLNTNFIKNLFYNL